MNYCCILLLLLFECFSTTVNKACARNLENKSLTVGIIGRLREVSPYYLSLAVSSQIVKDGLIGELASSKKFLTLCRGLSPAILRVGGSSSNFLTYDPSASKRNNPVREENRLYKRMQIFDEDFDPDLQLGGFENFTMSAQDYDNLKTLARSAGFRILFDLNQFYRTLEGSWDASNAFDIMKDADDSFLWQLGNEPNSYNYNYHHNFTGNMDASDFNLLREKLLNYYKDPVIVGPDVTNPRHRPKLKEDDGLVGKGATSMQFLQEFLTNLEFNLSAVTMHHYYLPGNGVGVENFTSLDTLDVLKWQIPEIVEVRDKFSPQTPIWLTETSSCYGGGAADLSNAYVAGFLWLDKLGLAATLGVDLLARQTLFMKRYALIDDNFVPYPDYWLSLLFKRLVGERVLQLEISGSVDTTRLYGHCQRANSTSYEPGNVVVFGINVGDETSTTVKFEGMPSELTVEQYLLQALNGNLQSKEVLLNGHLLQMTPDDELPELSPLRIPMQEFTIPPLSFGFWVIKKANVQDCVYEG